jgi:hypothetical protein
MAELLGTVAAPKFVMSRPPLLSRCRMPAQVLTCERQTRPQQSDHQPVAVYAKKFLLHR